MEEEEDEPGNDAIQSEQEDISQVLHQDKYTARDGTEWQTTAPQRHRTQQHNIVRYRAGPRNLPGALTQVLQAFRLYLSDKILNMIVGTHKYRGHKNIRRKAPRQYLETYRPN